MVIFRNILHTTYFLFLLLACAMAYGQTTIEGHVYDSETKEPLPFVNLSLQKTVQGTTSDINGYYKITTSIKTDSIVASFIGYETKAMKITHGITQTINIYISTENVALPEVVIKYTGNPAHRIIKAVSENREHNNYKNLPSYKYEVYNKVEFDLNNLTDRFKNRRVFKKFDFIFDNIDSSAEKEFLPMFLTETVSDFYYQNNPTKTKEYIKASRVSGLKNESISQFLGQMYQDINIYDNQLIIFGKTFISPISEGGLRHYRYYLKDSLVIDNHRCYEINFIPKHIQEPTFSGNLWISDTTFAVKRIEAKIGKNVNINFINDLFVVQDYVQTPSGAWMLEKDVLVADITLGDNVMGLYGRKTSMYKDFGFDVNVEEYLSGVENVEILDSATERDNVYWVQNRHEELSENEKGIYHMVDSLRRVPAFNSIIDLVTMFYTGYLKWGMLEFGPYYKTYSYNPVEGHRLRIGGRTSNSFSTRVMFTGHLAYGTLDERYKYGLGMDWIVKKKDRLAIGVWHKDDVQQLGQSQNALSQDNILNSAFRRQQNNKLTNIFEDKVFVEKDWFNGFSNKLILQTRKMNALGTLSYTRELANGSLLNIPYINTSEIILLTRFAFQEKFVSGEFERTSLGTKYPTLEFEYSKGLKLLNGDYDYTRMSAILDDKFRIGRLGQTHYRVEAGKYWGTLPYALLEIHNGNETYFYDQSAFNLMNYFEFISDQYVSVMVEQHFQGYFLDRIPLFRRLKWREVATFRSAIGSLDNKHRSEMVILENMYELGQPYVEGAVGIENIFKVFRVDALWRLTHLHHPNIAKFGIRGTFAITF